MLLKYVPDHDERHFFVGGHTLITTAGHAFGHLFNENQLADVRALLSCDGSR